MFTKRDAALRGLKKVRGLGRRGDYQLRVRGKQETLRNVTLKQAQDYRRDKLTDAGRGIVPVPGQLTFEDLIKPLPHPPSKRLREYFKGWRVRAITSAAVAAYEKERLDDGASRSTVNADLAALRHAFNLAIEHEVLTRKPVIKTPKPENVRTGFFDEPTLRAVILKLPEWARPIVECLWLTGWRVKSEVLRLTWHDNVDWRAKVLSLAAHETKSGKGRRFPFGQTPALVALLERQLAEQARIERESGGTSSLVFPVPGGESPDWRYKQLSKVWRRACRAVPAAKGRYLHDLRRSAARELRRAGVPEVAIMRLCGWDTHAMFERYNIIDEADLAEAAAKRQATALNPQTTG